MDADWYPDPSNPAQQRFWDGVSWTNHVYGPQGQGTDGGLSGAPPPGATAEFPGPQAPSPFPPTAGPGGPSYVRPGYGAPPAYGPPGAGGSGYAPPGGYGVAGYPGAPGPWSGGPGLVGRPTSPAIQILLTIVTLGIWALVWIYRQYRDIHNYSGVGVGGAVGVLINFIPVVGTAITYFLLPGEVQGLYEREGRRSPVTTLYGLLFLVPLVGGLIWYLLLQRAINDFWVGHGALRP